MEWWHILLIVVGALLIGGLISSIIFTMPIARKLHEKQWTRKNDEAFKRGCSDASVDYHLDMFNQGMKYRESNINKIKNLEIASLDTKLYAEYYDFGFDKVVMVLPGRTETALYGAYYAETFVKAGYNVLCMDPRAHGLSGGKYLKLGFDEAVDAINWAKKLHDEFGISHICLYGLCGGATASCLALTRKDCPNYIDSFINDGMFYSFYKVYRRHIVDEKKPVVPVIFEVMHLIKKYNKVNPYKAKPYSLIKKINVPTLFLGGELDKFSLNKETVAMCKRSPAMCKQVKIFKNARHSHLKYDSFNEYENTVISFLESI